MTEHAAQHLSTNREAECIEYFGAIARACPGDPDRNGIYLGM